MEYTWDPVNLVYLDEDGKRVGQDEIRHDIDDTCAQIALAFQSRADQWRSGGIQFNDFYVDTEREIESLHYACGALAFGGLANLNGVDAQQIEAFIQNQIAWFRAFMMQVYSEQISPDQTDARLAMYAMAGYATYENARAGAVASTATATGMMIYRRHCRFDGASCEDCEEFARRGWQLIGHLPGIGLNCKCRSNCRCYFTYSSDLTLLKNT